MPAAGSPRGHAAAVRGLTEQSAVPRWRLSPELNGPGKSIPGPFPVRGRFEPQYPYLVTELGAGAAPEALGTGPDPLTVAIEKPSTPLPVASPAFVSPCQ